MAEGSRRLFAEEGQARYLYTQAKTSAYLRNNGAACLHCKSEALAVTDVCHQQQQIRITKMCHYCGEQWIEVWHLADLIYRE